MPIRTATLIGLTTMLLATTAPRFAAAQSGDTSQQRPEVCTQEYRPVCGEKNGVTKTYPNACFAAADGAKVIATEPCR